jgi:hypothetical protein
MAILSWKGKLLDGKVRALVQFGADSQWEPARQSTELVLAFKQQLQYF